MDSVKLLLIPPPIHVEDAAAASPPGSILLDPFGYLSDRTNGTTAEGFTRDGKRILVTLWAASPPRVSCFTLHCPDLKPSAFGDLPRILTAEDDLLLLRVAIYPWDDYMYAENNDYFVYQAGTENKPPSLKLLPRPPAFSDSDAVLLRCRASDMYFVAVLCPWLISENYHLHLYSSQTETWITKVMYVDSQQQNYFRYPYTNKAISIGGELGTVAWVHLWRGILICDVLLEKNHLRCIKLPLPLVPRALEGYPMAVRNVIAVKGYIKYFELAPGLEAATKIMNISNIGSGDNWEMDCSIKLREVLEDSPLYAQTLLPSLEEGEDSKPILKFIGSYPALSLHDDDVVYIMNQPNPHVKKAVVIAVDMRSKTIKGVADFGSGRPVGYDFTYLQSGISKYLNIWSPARGNAAETSRKGIVASGKEEVSGEGVEAAT